VFFIGLLGFWIKKHIEIHEKRGFCRIDKPEKILYNYPNRKRGRGSQVCPADGWISFVFKRVWFSILFFTLDETPAHFFDGWVFLCLTEKGGNDEQAVDQTGAVD